jgi:hypothetical protein
MITWICGNFEAKDEAENVVEGRWSIVVASWRNVD